MRPKKYRFYPTILIENVCKTLICIFLFVGIVYMLKDEAEYNMTKHDQGPNSYSVWNEADQCYNER